MPLTGDLVMLLLAVLGGVGGLWWRIEGKFAAAEMERSRLARDLSDYKLFVAQNHVSATALREAETRLITAIEKLADRLDAITEKLDARNRL